MLERSFYDTPDHLMSETVAAQLLEYELGAVKKWIHWLRNDRRKPSPKIRPVEFMGYAVIYRGCDVYRYIDGVREEAINDL